MKFHGKTIYEASPHIYIIVLSITIVDRPGKWDSSGGTTHNAQGGKYTLLREEQDTVQASKIYKIDLSLAGKNLNNSSQLETFGLF
jgi:hypothetical protein